MSEFVVEFLTRRGCHICEEAHPRVVAAARRAGVEIRPVDIDGDDRLVVDYGLRIPVLLGAGSEVIAEGEMGTTADLVRLLRDWRRTQNAPRARALPRLRGRRPDRNR